MKAKRLGTTAADIDICFKDAASTQQDCRRRPGHCPPTRSIGCIAIITVRHRFTAVTPVISNIVGQIDMASTTRIPIERVYSVIERGSRFPARHLGARHDPHSSGRRATVKRGQALVIMVGAMIAVIAMAGLIVDGGNAWAQQRDTQNGTDAAAEAGAIVIVQNYGGAPHPIVAVGTARSPLPWPVPQRTTESRVPTAYYTNVTGQLLNAAGAVVANRNQAAVVGAGPSTHRVPRVCWHSGPRRSTRTWLASSASPIGRQTRKRRPSQAPSQGPAMRSMAAV